MTCFGQWYLSRSAVCHFQVDAWRASEWFAAFSPPAKIVMRSTCQDEAFFSPSPQVSTVSKTLLQTLSGGIVAWAGNKLPWGKPLRCPACLLEQHSPAFPDWSWKWERRQESRSGSMKGSLGQRFLNSLLVISGSHESFQAGVLTWTNLLFFG